MLFTVGFVVGGCSAGGPPDSPTSLGVEDLAVLVEIMAEEDRRPAFADASAMRGGLTSDNALIRRFAARGLGRLEEPTVLAALGPTLADPDAAVRSTVAGAIAQSVFNADTGAAADLLRGRLADEPDPAVRGALAQALGRLRPNSVAAIEETQAILAGVVQRGVPVETLVPALRGLESLLRTNRADIECRERQSPHPGGGEHRVGVRLLTVGGLNESLAAAATVSRQVGQPFPGPGGQLDVGSIGAHQ